MHPQIAVAKNNGINFETRLNERYVISEDITVIMINLNVVTGKFEHNKFLFLSITSPSVPAISESESMATTKLIAPIYLGKK